MSNEEVAEYEKSLKNYRDWYSSLSTAENKGIKKGRVEGIVINQKDTILNCHKAGYSIEIMSTVTGLSPEEIMKIIAELKREGYI